MIINWIIRYFSGYVKFEARNGFVERLINLCSLNNITLWDFEKTEEGFIATVMAKDYKHVKEYSKRTNIETQILQKKGFIFKANKYKNRWGLILGLAIFLIMIIVSQNFVWEINVVGNEKVSEKVILSELSEIGVHKLSFIPKIDFRLKKQQALLRLPQLSWLTINRNGCKLSVSVTERKLPPLVRENTPCDIIASKTGQIRYMEVYKGTTLIKLNYTVKEGDVMVSSAITNKKGETKYVHADAKIIAEVQFDKELSIDMNQMSKEYTGKMKNRHFLNIFNFKIPLFIATNVKGSYDITSNNNMISLFGKELPIGIYTLNYKFYNKKSDEITVENAREVLENSFLQYEAVELKDCAILKRVKTEELKKGIFKMKISYTAEENIAKKAAANTNGQQNIQ